MCIVTGPNMDIATKLIRRLKNIFERRLGIYFDNKETVLELNGCSIEAYPSNHIDSFRSLVPQNRGDESILNLNCYHIRDTQLCKNEGDGSNMNMNCAYTGGSCSQTGDGSTMNMNCARMEVGCSNAANPGNPSKMSVDCANGGACRNLWLGSGGSDTQFLILNLSKVGVLYSVVPQRGQGTTQTTICNSAGGFFPEGCANEGRDTTVLANGAQCSSGAPGTTTVCQPGRTLTFPK